MSSFQGIHEKQRKWRQEFIPNTSKTVVGPKKIARPCSSTSPSTHYLLNKIGVKKTCGTLFKIYSTY